MLQEGQVFRPVGNGQTATTRSASARTSSASSTASDAACSNSSSSFQQRSVLSGVTIRSSFSWTVSKRQEALTVTGCLSRCLDKLSAAKQEEMVRLVRDAAGRDPADGLAAVAALAGLLEVLESLHVERARRSGWSWEAIAQKLGVSRQAVHQKHGDLERRKQRLGKRGRR